LRPRWKLPRSILGAFKPLARSLTSSSAHRLCRRFPLSLCVVLSLPPGLLGCGAACAVFPRVFGLWRCLLQRTQGAASQKNGRRRAVGVAVGMDTAEVSSCVPLSRLLGYHVSVASACYCLWRVLRLKNVHYRRGSITHL